MASAATDRESEDVGPLDMDRVFGEVYAELKRVAHRRLEAEQDGHTLNTTALVNETWMRLAQQRTTAYNNRAHFFALAALAMRRILVDYARRHRSQKREGDHHRVPLEDVEHLDQGMVEPSAHALLERAELLLGIDRALEELRELDPRAATVVECRFFLAMKDEDIADSLGLTIRTVGRDWSRARAWMKERLTSYTGGDG